ncbi:Kelch-like protein 10 [Nymphon striatum]|nr:Kelch-like protein 10 [Nymphon striatum]
MNSYDRLELLREIYNDKSLTDAVLKVNSETEFPVSRAIMASCSPYFRTLFKAKEYADLRKEKLIVTLPGIEERELKSIIEFAYVRQVTINDENVQDLTVAADQFNVIKLLEECIQYIVKNIDYENCIGVWKFSSFYSFIKLKNQATQFIFKNFAKILRRSEEYYDLTVEELKKILQNDRLSVPTEKTVWGAVIQWIESDEKTRIKHYGELLRMVRIGSLCIDYVQNIIFCHPYSENNREFGLTRNVTWEIPFCCVPRKPSHMMYVIGGFSESRLPNPIETYDYIANTWTQVAIRKNDNLCRSYHGCVAIGHRIYIIGGTVGHTCLSDCYVFNTLNNAWSEIAPMHVNRCSLSVAVIGDFVYAVGGNEALDCLRTVEKYDISTNQWNYVASMNFVRTHASVNVINGKLYAIGGFDGTRCLNTVEMFNPDTNTWSNLPNMTVRRSGVVSVVCQSYIYALGGSNGQNILKSIEKFSPSLGYWIPLQDMNEARSNFSADVLDNFIYVAGGFSGRMRTRSVECYDICQNTWHYLFPMTIPRSDFTVCFIENSYSSNEPRNSSTEDSH